MIRIKTEKTQRYDLCLDESGRSNAHESRPWGRMTGLEDFCTTYQELSGTTMRVMWHASDVGKPGL
jgi:hypothetical protein